MLEREVKLGAGPGFHLPQLGDPAAGLLAAPAEETRLDTVYFDTADLRLARWGYSLRHRAHEGWTLKVPEDGEGDAIHREEVVFDGPGKRPPAQALALVSSMVRGAELAPVAHLWTRRIKVRIEDLDGARVADVVDDEVSVLHGRRVAARFRELEVELAESAGSGVLEPLVSRLQAAGAGPPDSTPKHVRAIGPLAQQPPEVSPLKLGRSASGGDLVRHLFAAAVETLIRRDPGIRLGGDPEHVHQARVSVRRLRSHLRTFQDLLEPAWTSGLRGELSWLGGELGAVRDAEVMHDRLRDRLQELPDADRTAGASVLRRLEREVEANRRRLLAALDSARYLELLERLVLAAQQPSLTPLAEQPAASVLPGLARSSWRKLRSAARALPENPPDDQLHALRIRAKRARYAAEAAALVSDGGAARFAKAAARLQTVLGEHQDSVTAQVWLRAASLRGRPAFVAGELYATERAMQARARQAWPAAWAALDHRRLTRWIPASTHLETGPPPQQ